MKRASSTPNLKPTATVTLTFGDQAENHVGMQKVGSMAKEGFSIQDLKEAEKKFLVLGCVCEFVDLNKNLPKGTEATGAGVLIVRGGVDAILKAKDKNKTSEDLLKEQMRLSWDSKAKMYGRVVKKTARHNLCFDENGQKPDYENGKGTIIAFKDVPITKLLRNTLQDYIGEKAKDLTIEGNLYYDVKKCGIGFHGDAERKKVIGIRIGEKLPLHYQWFQKGRPIGERVKLSLNDGDLYIMSEKATGNDWKKKIDCTLRHAAGCDKYLQIKEKPIVVKKKKKVVSEEEESEEESD